MRLSILSPGNAIRLCEEVYTLSRMGEGRAWDLNAQRIFSALRLKILMPGAKNRRQALRSHTPALSLPGEGINLLASAFALPSEKIDSHWSWKGSSIGSLEIPSDALSLTRERVRVWVS